VEGASALQKPQNPGLPFQLSVSKLDAYGQVGEQSSTAYIYNESTAAYLYLI
jgi:hypothetical protein